jgi:hypothetical protein
MFEKLYLHRPTAGEPNLLCLALTGVWITTRQLAKCEWNSRLTSRVIIQTHLPHVPVWRGFFSLSLTLSIFFGQLFSALASENTELLASLASVLKNVFTPLALTTILKIEKKK